MQDMTTTPQPSAETDSRSQQEELRIARIKAIKRLRLIASWMDTAFEIPGTGQKAGLDSLIGLIPGIGDAASSLVSLEFIRQGYLLGASNRVLVLMAGNILVDLLVGSIPVLGDLFDVAFKANTKNLQLLEKEFGLETVSS